MSYKIAVVQQKGGAGKTTLVCQLAGALLSLGYEVAAIDTDEQQSLNFWATLRRDALGEAAGALTTYDTSRNFALSKLHNAERAADIVLIDTPPHNSSLIRAAVRVADLVLVPMQLTPFDFHATLATAETIANAQAEYLFVPNRVPPRSRIANDIRAEFLANGFAISEASLGDRTAFAESIMTGQSVMETAYASKAAEELDALLEEVLERRGRETLAA